MNKRTFSALSAESRSKRFLRLGDWKLRLSQLPAAGSGAPDRGTLRDYAFESPKGNRLAVVHSAYEARMGLDGGMLAVFEDKEHPELVFGKRPCWIYLDKDVWLSEDLLVASAAAADQDLNLSWIPFLLCDLRRRAVSLIPVASAFSYTIRKERNEVVIEDKRAPQFGPPLSKMSFKLRDLPWMGFEQAEDLPNIARFCCFYLYHTEFGAHRL